MNREDQQCLETVVVSSDPGLFTEGLGYYIAKKLLNI